MNIKAIREELMLTQSEFAELVGVTFHTVSNWERGKAKPYLFNKREIIKLCEEKGIVWQDTK